jgi:non-specific serine/threonine protein kinase
LFVDRCAAFQPTFALTDENATDIVRICRRLDGVPLALELAAARVRVLSVAQVANRLDDRFRLLTGGGRTVVARQQTLRALIDWSYDLLSDAERLLLRRLSVFVRGWTLDGAEAVCAGDGIEREAILDLLAHLVDKSLVVMLERGGAARYAMLETVREYAREKLVDSGEALALRKRHFDHYSRFAADKGRLTVRTAGASPDVSSEYENLRAALEWIEAEPNGNESGLLLASGMLGAAASRGRIGELRRLLTEALARADPTSRTPGRALALGTVAMLEAMQGDIQLAGTHNQEAVRLLRALDMKRELAYALGGVARATIDDHVVSGRAWDEARVLFAELGDQWGLAMMLFVMADAVMERGDYDAARTGHTESLALFRGLGELTMSTNPLVSLARLACIDGEYARARAMVEEALTIRQRPEVDNPWMVAIALDSLGEVARCEGDPARGTRSFEQALGYGRALRDDMIISWSLHNLAHVALYSGDLAAGAAQFRESLALRWARGPGVDVATGLAGMAGVALRDGEFADAAKLFGAVDGMLDTARTVLAPADEQVRRGDLATLRERLDKDILTAATREGRATGFEELQTLSNAIALRVGGRSR